MKQLKHKLVFLCIIMAALFIVPCFVIAQEAASENSATELQIDETVTAQDLGVGEQNVLPGSFWYGFKEIWRGARVILTVDRLKKAELRLEHANERIIEAQNLVEEKGDEESLEKIGQVMERYQKDMEKAQEAISKITIKMEDNPQLEQFAEKLTNSEINKRKVLQKLESNKNISEVTMGKVIIAKEKSGEKFGQIIQEIVSSDKIAERIEVVLETQAGSEFKDIKQLQIIKDIKENVSPEMREQLEKVEVNRMDNISDKLRQANTQVKERVNQYLEDTSGDEVNQLEVINDIKTKTSISGVLRNGLEIIEESKAKIFEEKVQGIQNESLKEMVLNRMESEGETLNPVKERLQVRPIIKEAIIQKKEQQKEKIQEQKEVIIQKQEQKKEEIQEQKGQIIQKQEQKKEMIEEQKIDDDSLIAPQPKIQAELKNNFEERQEVRKEHQEEIRTDGAAGNKN